MNVSPVVANTCLSHPVGHIIIKNNNGSQFNHLHRSLYLVTRQLVSNLLCSQPFNHLTVDLFRLESSEASLDRENSPEAQPQVPSDNIVNRIPQIPEALAREVLSGCLQVPPPSECQRQL